MSPLGRHRVAVRRDPEGVQVSTTESFSGDPVEADRESMQAMLHASLAGWLTHMKAAAETT